MEATPKKRWLTYNKVAAIVLVLEAAQLIRLFTVGDNLSTVLFGPIVWFLMLYLVYGVYLLVRWVVRKVSAL